MMTHSWAFPRTRGWKIFQYTGARPAWQPLSWGRIALLGLVCTFCTGLDASPDNPRTWPERFSETYRFRTQSLGQLTLDWEGLEARRFFLVLEGNVPFSATLTRDRDASMLFQGRRASRYETVIDWGRDELAQLTVSTDRPQGLTLTLRVALDPREKGREIYSFQVNRFLRLYSEHEFDKAAACLRNALVEDPADSMAALLWRKLQSEKSGQEKGTANQL